MCELCKLNIPKKEMVQIKLEENQGIMTVDKSKFKKIKPSSPSHPSNLYGSASSMTTNWDW